MGKCSTQSVRLVVRIKIVLQTQEFICLYANCHFIIGILINKTFNIGTLEKQTCGYDNIRIKFRFYDTKHKNDKYSKGNDSIHCMKSKCSN